MSIAGALRERVSLQSFTGTTTDAGDRAEVWADYATDIPARMQPKAVSDVARAMREVAEARYVATIRNRPGVKALHRLVWGSRTFTIDGVKNLDERGHYLVLDLGEVAL